MTVPNRTASSTAYRYGFNGMEKDDELKGIGNSYDFGERMLDPRIGRFFSTDSIFQPYETPYNFAANNPIIYVDSEGGDNIIYIVLLPSAYESLTKTEVNAIVTKLNAKFKKLGLKTEVKLYNNPEPFDSRNLDLTDTYAILGSVNKIKTEISKNPEKHLDLATSNMDSEFTGGLGNPEFSANKSERISAYRNEKKNGTGIAVDSDALGVTAEQSLDSDKATAAVYIILHGLSHNAGEEHNVSYAIGKDYGVIVNSIDNSKWKAAGKSEISSISTAEDVMSAYENITKIADLPENYPDVVKRRLGDNKPKDNYSKNKKKNESNPIGPRRADGKF